MKQLCCLMIVGLSVSPAAWAVEKIPGVLHWGRSVNLGVPVSGVVATVNVNVGDQVDKNQVLLRLDQRPFKAKVRQTRANLARSRQTMLEAQREHERAKVLYDRMVLPNKDLLQAEAAYLAAKAEQQSIQANLQQVELEQTYSLLRAPFQGVIAKRNVEVGQTIVSRLQAEPLVMLVENSRMIARIQAPESTLDRFTQGKTVTVLVGEHEFLGEITTVGVEPQIKAAAIFYNIDIGFSSKDQFLRAGQGASVIMP